MEPTRLNYNSTEFQPEDVLLFGLSDLPTKKEREAEEHAAALQRVTQTAYKTVQQIQIENGELGGWPTDPTQLANVATQRLVRFLRTPELQEDEKVDFWREAA